MGQTIELIADDGHKLSAYGVVTLTDSGRRDIHFFTHIGTTSRRRSAYLLGKCENPRQRTEFATG